VVQTLSDVSDLWIEALGDRPRPCVECGRERADDADRAQMRIAKDEVREELREFYPDRGEFFIDYHLRRRWRSPEWATRLCWASDESWCGGER